MRPDPDRRRLWRFEWAPLNWSPWFSVWPITREQAWRQKRLMSRITFPVVLVLVFGGILLELLGVI